MVVSDNSSGNRLIRDENKQQKEKRAPWSGARWMSAGMARDSERSSCLGVAGAGVATARLRDVFPGLRALAAPRFDLQAGRTGERGYLLAGGARDLRVLLRLAGYLAARDPIEFASRGSKGPQCRPKAGNSTRMRRLAKRGIERCRGRGGSWCLKSPVISKTLCWKFSSAHSLLRRSKMRRIRRQQAVSEPKRFNARVESRTRGTREPRERPCPANGA